MRSLPSSACAASVRSTDHLHELVELYQRGALEVTVRARFPLGRVAEAHRAVEHGHGQGKVVVTVGHG